PCNLPFDFKALIICNYSGIQNSGVRIQNEDGDHKEVAPLAGRSYKFPTNSCSCRACPCHNHSYA
ncbi:hypothetical protein KKG56_08540, partial [bacterium]|nr:hypothetical protein [bacterium]